MWRLAAVLLLLAMGAPAQAAVISQRPDHVAVTIYHQDTVPTSDLIAGYASRTDGLAMIAESRTVDLPEGDSEIEFRGVASTMVPQTAGLDGLEDVTPERNFDYDLLSPAALLQKAVGETVHLVRTDRRTGETIEQSGTLLSGPAGPMLKIGDHYEELQCFDLPGKLVFDRIPQGLKDQPTLTIKVRTRKAGRYTLTLRYVATGLNWSADYVARVRPNGKSLDLSGWLTLANFSESGFAAASVDVIAGHVQVTGDDVPTEVEIPRVFLSCLAENKVFQPPPPPARPQELFFGGGGEGGVEMVSVSAARIIIARDMGDYKQYPLPEPTDMAAQQVKQVQFLEQPDVPFERVYVCRADDYNWPNDQTWVAKILLRLRNTKQKGLGKPLPAGGVMTMVAAKGGALLADQGSLQDIPVGLPVEISAGDAPDVTATAREREEHRIGTEGNHRRVYVIEVALTNRKPVRVQAEWNQAMYDDATVTAETAKHELRNGDLSWSVSLAPGEQKVLRYTLEVVD
jgi:hypothetical protein